jgi:hypothetical protein
LVSEGRVRSVGLEVDVVSAWQVTVSNGVFSHVVSVCERKSNVRELGSDILLSLSVSESKFDHDEVVNCDGSDDWSCAHVSLIDSKRSVTSIKIWRTITNNENSVRNGDSSNSGGKGVATINLTCVKVGDIGVVADIDE